MFEFCITVKGERRGEVVEVVVVVVVVRVFVLQDRLSVSFPTQSAPPC